jgi:TolB-like protein
VKCPNCKIESATGVSFCPHCGTQIGRPQGEGFSQTRTIVGVEARYQPGQLIGGRYEVQSVAGRGGMGVVYKAQDTKLKRTVALKFLPHEWTADAAARERFIHEAQAASALDHPNICTIYEIEETDDGRMYISMAFYEGESLRDRIKSGPLKTEEAVDIAIQVGQGMAEAHQKGIVHRDIKPANILMTKDGAAKIVDFGLAKLAGRVQLTREGTTLGTVAYMSPEQARGDAVDERTDIWSLGVVLYEMLSGKLPFKGEFEQTLIHSILKSDPEPITKSRKDLPPGLENIIAKALSKNPTARYRTMDELVEDLKAVAEGLKPLRAKADVFRGRILGIKKIHAAAGLSLIVVLAVLALLFVFPKHGPAYDSLAVLPFADLSPAKDQDHIAEGLADELIHALGRIQEFRVAARTSAFALKDQKLDVKEIGKKLDVRAVLEGSVQKAGKRLRVTTRLLDARTGLRLWSEQFDREEADVFDIQDQISLAIVENLKITLLAGEKAALRKRATSDTEAYNLYLKGVYFQARPNPDSIQKALGFYNEAIARDPKFAQPHAALAFAYMGMANMNLAPPAEMYQKAKAELEKAFALDPDLAEAHAMAASLQFWFEWNWPAAEKSFDRVLALNPGDATSRGSYAWLLMTRRRFDESVREIKRVQAIDPLAPLYYAWSIALHNTAGRYDEALAEFAKVQQIDPNFGLAYFHAAMSCFMKGLYDDAIGTIERGSEFVVFPGWNEALLLLAHLKKGDVKKAGEILAGMLESRKKLPISPVCIAWGTAALGDLDGAFRWLDTAIQEHDTLMCFIHVYTGMLLPTLARDPRYDAILKKMNLSK